MQLKEEFGLNFNSAAIHKKLTSRKMENDETCHHYFLNMKQFASHGNIEDKALMEYVIDGIRDSESNKMVLYQDSNLKEFRKKFDIYSDIKKKLFSLSSPSTTRKTTDRMTTKVKRCFKCSDHKSPVCTNGVKYFKCNEFDTRVRQEQVQIDLRRR